MASPSPPFIDARQQARIRRMLERFEQTGTGMPEDRRLAEIERATTQAH